MHLTREISDCYCVTFNGPHPDCTLCAGTGKRGGVIQCSHMSAGCLGCPHSNKLEHCPVVVQFEDTGTKLTMVKMIIRLQKEIKEINPRKC